MYNCVFYWREVICIVYVDDVIFTSPSGSDINQEIMEIGVKFYIEYQGTLYNYIGFNIVSLPNRKVKLLQHQLIDQIVQDVNLTLDLADVE